MTLFMRVEVEPSTTREAMNMIDVGIEYFESAIQEADIILHEQKVNLDDVDTTAGTPLARIAALVAAESSIHALREMFEEICIEIENDLPSPDDFAEVDK